MALVDSLHDFNDIEEVPEFINALENVIVTSPNNPMILINHTDYYDIIDFMNRLSSQSGEEIRNEKTLNDALNEIDNNIYIKIRIEPRQHLVDNYDAIVKEINAALLIPQQSIFHPPEEQKYFDDSNQEDPEPLFCPGPGLYE